MKIKGEYGLGSFLKNLLMVCFILGIIILISAPFVLQQLFSLKIHASFLILYPNGIVLLLTTYNFMKLFDSLKNNNPFCDLNVRILKRTGIISLVGSGFWLIDTIYEIFLAQSTDIVFIGTLAFLVILFFGVSIALYILSELLNEAVKYKEENDLTI